MFSSLKSILLPAYLLSFSIFLCNDNSIFFIPSQRQIRLNYYTYTLRFNKMSKFSPCSGSVRSPILYWVMLPITSTTPACLLFLIQRILVSNDAEADRSLAGLLNNIYLGFPGGNMASKSVGPITALADPKSHIKLALPLHTKPETNQHKHALLSAWKKKSVEIS